MAQHAVRSPPELQQACSVAEAGDVILVYGGLYDKPSVMEKCAGRPDHPIVFKAADDEWISGGRSPDPYWGGTTPAQDAPQKPGVKDFAFLIIDECTHVVIDGLKIRECWPSILFVKDSVIFKSATVCGETGPMPSMPKVRLHRTCLLKTMNGSRTTQLSMLFG